MLRTYSARMWEQVMNSLDPENTVLENKIRPRVDSSDRWDDKFAIDLSGTEDAVVQTIITEEELEDVEGVI